MICDYLAEKIGFKQGLIFTAILRLQRESYYTTNTSASVVDYNKQIKIPQSRHSGETWIGVRDRLREPVKH